MLKNMGCTELATLFVLHDSDFLFYLTGSRFFETTHPNSDWDFFVANSDEVITFLQHNGFILDESPEYEDCTIVQVYRHVQDVQDVHVQLIDSDNIVLKCCAQSIIYNHNIFDGTVDKLTRRKIWSMVMSILNTHHQDK
jgi:hypothetical protein